MSVQKRFGISLDGADAPHLSSALVTEADRAGAASVWIASHLFHREPIACAAMSLAASRRTGIVLMAMSPYTVHPVYATMAAATLDEYFPGRVQLCFGAGAPRDLEAVGLSAEQPVLALRETIAISRALLAGETVSYVGRRFSASGRRLAGGARPLPIWLAASGPHTLELAGAAADGALISAATSPEFIRSSLEHVRRGERRTGREVQKAALVFCSVDDNERAARDRLRRPIAYILRGQHHARNLELAGTQLDQAALARAFAAEDWTRVESLVTDDILRRHTAGGTPKQFAAALSAYREVGLDEVIVYGIRDREQMKNVLAVMRD
jgi:5,10-methylenetetrahydromethanopterin reductase